MCADWEGDARDLERRVEDIPAQHNVYVTLYLVEENGYKIAHDTPAIGAWTEYGHWEQSHGPYRRRADAERKEQEIRRQYRDASCEEVSVRLTTIEVRENEIEQFRERFFFKGEEISPYDLERVAEHGLYYKKRKIL